jgi:flagellar motor switch protein FliN
MNAVTDLDSRVLAAASAAAGALWSPAPLEPAEPVLAAVAAGLIPEGGSGFAATFSGSASGVALLVVDAEMAQTLKESSIGTLSLGDAARGVLEAATATLGPIVLDELAEVDPAAALSEFADLVVVPLTADGALHAALALQVAEVESPRSAPSAGGHGAGVIGNRSAYDLLMDVEMDVTAELGRTRMTVRNLLDLEPGSIVELDRMAGSPVDLLVNGRLIAKGEVVVIDEEFALRVTEIVASAVEADR